MLKLTRKKGQAIMIGEDIKIHIFGHQNGQVKVGVEAPEHIQILREELLTASQNNEEITLTLVDEAETSEE